MLSLLVASPWPRKLLGIDAATQRRELKAEVSRWFLTGAVDANARAGRAQIELYDGEVFTQGRREQCPLLCKLLRIAVHEIGDTEADVERVFSRFKMMHPSKKPHLSAAMNTAMCTVNFWCTEQNEVAAAALRRAPGGEDNQLRVDDDAVDVDGDAAVAAAAPAAAAAAVPVRDDARIDVDIDERPVPPIAVTDQAVNEHTSTYLHYVWETLMIIELEQVKEEASNEGRAAAIRCKLCNQVQARHTKENDFKVKCTRCAAFYFLGCFPAMPAVAQSALRSGQETWSCEDCRGRSNTGVYNNNNNNRA